MSEPTRPHRTCAELGVCQNRPTRCLLCANDPAPWQPDEVTCTPVEQIAYWAAVTVAACFAGGAVVGVAAYVYGRFF